MIPQGNAEPQSGQSHPASGEAAAVDDLIRRRRRIMSDVRIEVMRIRARMPMARPSRIFDVLADTQPRLKDHFVDLLMLDEIDQMTDVEIDRFLAYDDRTRYFKLALRVTGKVLVGDALKFDGVKKRP